jgi:hypothetical protein
MMPRSVRQRGVNRLRQSDVQPETIESSGASSDFAEENRGSRFRLLIG